MMHRARRGGGNNPAIGIVQINPVATLNIAGNCNVTRHLQRCLVAPTFGEVLTAVQKHSGFCHSYVLAVRGFEASVPVPGSEDMGTLRSWLARVRGYRRDSRIRTSHRH